MAKKQESKPTSYAVVFFAKIPMESLGSGLTEIAAAMPPQMIGEVLADFEVKDSRKPKKKSKAKAKKQKPSKKAPAK